MLILSGFWMIADTWLLHSLPVSALLAAIVTTWQQVAILGRDRRGCGCCVDVPGHHVRVAVPGDVGGEVITELEGRAA